MSTLRSVICLTVCNEMKCSQSLPRHEFYETDERLTLSIFDRNAEPSEVNVQFEPRKVRVHSSQASLSADIHKFTYAHGDKSLVLAPLKGQINPESCEYTVGKVKVEVRLTKMVPGRWGALVGDSPDRKWINSCK